jgi:hypothetical protein
VELSSSFNACEEGRRREPRTTPGRWDTWEVKARVLGVVRNVTSATRLRDVLSLLRRTDGIEVWYTINPGSRFDAGLLAYFASLEEEDRLLRWDDAVASDDFDLAVACAVNQSMARLRPPLVVLPHGAGYNRLVRESTGDSNSPAGLSRKELTHEGKVVPTLIALSHEEQLSRLARSCPEALPYAGVFGDPCFDQAMESRQSRDRYRLRLGAAGGRRLVVINSTWSEHSLLGQCPDLPLRLVTSLPVDEFRVALVTHPNVWAWHGKRGVRDQLAEALDAGLVVLPPQEGWRAALIAGDWIVGDHGSTTFYGSAMGHPTMLAADGLEELDPASPTARFARLAPRLNPEGDLHAQLLDAAERHVPEVLRAITDESAPHGDSARPLRDKLYEMLAHRGVPRPHDRPRLPPVPEPEPIESRGPQTFDVEGAVEESHPCGEGRDTGSGEGGEGGSAEDGRAHGAGEVAVRIRRFPLAAGRGERTEPRGFHVVTDEETHPVWPDSAAVMVRTLAECEVPALRWVEDAAARHSGLNVAVAALGRHRALVRLRGGRLLEAYVPSAWGVARPRLDPALLGSAVNAVIEGALADAEVRPGPPERAQAPDMPGTLTIRTGEESLTVRLAREP